jgi:shikimate kinase
VSTIFEGAPYQNLIVTGPMGVGKTTIGRTVGRRLNATVFDLENEILAREGQTPESIRELFGEARLKALEAEMIRDLTLRRQSVLVISGPAVIEDANRARLAEAGPIVCLTCALDEILRRVYVARGAWFHSPANRGALLSRLKRELRVTALDLPQIDTTRLSIDQAAEAVGEFWFSHAQA